MQQDLIKNGAIYGIPLEVDTLALFINKKMFDDAKAQVPTTWDGFITVARSLTKKDPTGKILVSGGALGTYSNITHASDILSLLLVQNGVDLASMTPASNASDALTFYTSFAKDEENVWDTTLDPSLLAFEREKLAMYIGYSWDIFAMKAASPDLNFAVYPVPHLPGRNTTIASYWVEGVSSKTAHPKEAMQFIHFLSQKDTQTKLYTTEAKTRSFGEPYAQVDLASLLKSNNLVYPFVLQAANASSTYFSSDTQDTGITTYMNQYVENAVNSVLKDTSADSAVEALTQGVSQVLNQYAPQTQ
jgi:ABC-type glycerol-3-phosphate transport system substrate-binding protein